MTRKKDSPASTDHIRPISVQLALEPRYLFDAAALVSAMHAVVDHVHDGSPHESLGDGHQRDAVESVRALFSHLADAPPTDANGGTTLLIVDPRVQDYQSLIADLDPSIQVYVLDPTRDGVSQVSEILADNDDVTSLQILSHGGVGKVYLGTTELDAKSLDTYAGELAHWNDALADGADILLYGCQVGADDTGIDFIDRLGELTGADVAASDDITGAGGDWNLEVTQGDVTSPVPFDPIALSTYEYSFATVEWDAFNAINSDWSTSANWIGGVPQTGDMVVINTTDTINFNTTVDVASLTISNGATLNINGGTLTLSGVSSEDAASSINLAGGTLSVADGSGDPGADLIADGSLSINNGTLTGVGTVTAANPVSWTSGTISGTGTLVANAGIDIISNPGGHFQLDRTIDLYGDSTWSDSFSMYGTGGNTATINNYGTLTVNAAAEWYGSGADSNAAVNNFGTVIVDVSNYAGFRFPFGNAGTVQVLNGLLFFDQGGTSTGGTFEVADGTTLAFYTGTYNFDVDSTLATYGGGAGTGVIRFDEVSGAFDGTWSHTGPILMYIGYAPDNIFNVNTPVTTTSVSGSGGALNFNDAVDGITTLNLTGAQVNFNGTADLSALNSITITGFGVDLGANDALNVQDLSLAEGTLTTSGTLAVANPVSWSSGTLAGSGTLVANGGINIGVGYYGSGVKILDGITLQSEGTTTWTLGTIELQNGAMLQNNGDFHVQVDAGVNIVPGTGGGSIINDGIFIRDGGTGINSINVGLTNTGTLQVESGGIEFGSSFAQTAGAMLVGPDGSLLHAGGTSPFAIDGGTVGGSGTIIGGLMFTGASPGTLAAGASAGTLTIAGNLTLASNTDVQVDVEIGDPDPGLGSYDVIDVSGDVDLGGATATLAFVGPYAGHVGDKFNVIIYGGTESGTLNATGPASFSYQLNSLAGIDQIEIASAPINWDNDSGDDSWSNPLNWSNDALPTASDDVVINDVTGVVNISSGPVTVNSLAVNGETVNLNTGVTLNVVSSATFDSASTLNINGGAIDGHVDVFGSASWTAGTIAGSDTLVINPGATLEIGFGVKTLTGTLENTGTVNDLGDFTIADGATFINQAGATFDFQSSGVVTLDGTFVNDGTVQKTTFAGGAGFVSSTGTGVFDHSTGIIDEQTGELSFNGSFNHQGTFSTSGGQIELFGDVSGVQTFAPGSSIAGDVLWQSGNLAGEVTIDSTGVVTVGSGSALEITGTVDNAGTFNNPGGFTIVEGATFTNEAGATFDFQSGYDVILDGTFVNQGTVLKTTSTSTARFVTATVGGTGVFDHSTGIIDEQTGELVFSGAFTHQGTFSTTANAIEIGGGTQTFATGSSIAGNVLWESGNLAGTVTVDNGATLRSGASAGTITGTLNNSGTVDVDGNFNIGAGGTFNLQNGGTLTGAGTLTVNDTLNWTGGTQSGTGTTIVADGGTMTISGSSHLLDARTLQNAGTAAWTGGTIQFQNGALLDNSGTFYVRVGDGINMVSGTGGGNISNSGTFIRDTSTGTSWIAVGFTNSGLLLGGTGAIDFRGSFVQTTAGNMLTLPGGTLMSAGGSAPFEIDGGAVGGSGTISGGLTFTGVSPGAVVPGNAPGTLTLAGDLTLAANTTVIAALESTSSYDVINVSTTGDIDGTLDVSLINSFVPQAGDSFTILSAASLAGGFSVESLPDLSAQGLIWEVDYGSGNSVVLNVVPANSPPIADYPQTQNLLVNPSFETPETVTGGYPSTAGDWLGNAATIVGAENGVTPADGSQMLRLDGTQPTGSGDANVAGEMWQIIDLTAYSAEIDTGEATLSVSALFNRVAGDASTNTELTITISAYSGDPSGFPSQWDTGEPAQTTSIITDGDPDTWEALNDELAIPVGTDYVAVTVAAVENVSNDNTAEVDGHYVDQVSAQLNLPSPYPVEEDGQVTLTLRSHDPDGDPITTRVTALPGHGSLYQTSDGVTLGAEITSVDTIVTDVDGRVIYIPDGDYNGPDNIAYSVDDGSQTTTFVKLDPTATYLHTNGDSATNAMPIALSDLGIAPGDWIRLQAVGDYDIGGGYGERSYLGALFSGSDTLLPATELNRVPDALDAGVDFTSSPTANGAQATDIPEDFRVSDGLTFDTVVVQVPEGASYLFVSALDSLYDDNTDTDNGGAGDFGVQITLLSAEVNLDVTPVNDPPDLINPIADQQAVVGYGFSFQFASDVFNDRDGDELTYTAGLAGGDPLPSWLSFDGTTRTFSGSPGEVPPEAPYTIEVTADDGHGGVTTDTFVLAVTPPGSLSYPDFSNASALTLNGAAIQTGDALQLTNDYNQAGSAFTSSPVTLEPDNGSFSTAFAFQISDPAAQSGFADSDVPGGDGIVFVVQPNDPTALGRGGNGIGYFGISNSLGVELDTYPYPATEGDVADPNHVGVDLGGNGPSVATAHIDPPFNDGTVKYAWIDYDGTTDTLEIRISDSNIRPTDPTLVQTVDLETTLGTNQVYVGFTSGAGLASNDHDILAWQFTAAYAPYGDLATADVAPTDIGLSASSVDENAAGGTVVGTLTSTDANSGDSFLYSIEGDTSGGAFGINGDQLVVADGSLLNYEAASSHQVTIRSTDAGGAYYEEVFTIDVNNLAETITWDGGASNDDWFAAANWSQDFVPTAIDDVVLDAGAGQVAIGAGSASINALRLNSATLKIDGGALDLAAASTTDAAAVIDLNDATLSGTGSLALNGTLSSDGASTISLVLDNDSNNSVHVDSGTLVLSGGGTSTGTFTTATGATLQFQSGTFNFDGATIDGTGDVLLDPTSTGGSVEIAFTASGLSIQAANLTLLGGGDGEASAIGGPAASALSVDLTGTLSLTGGTGAGASAVLRATEQVEAADVVLTGGDGDNASAVLSGIVGGTQTVTATDSIQLTGGTGSDTFVGIQSDRDQNISAASISLEGGPGFNAWAALTSFSNQQTISTTVGDVTLQGGSNEYAEAALYAVDGGQTLNIAGDLIMNGGSAAYAGASVAMTGTFAQSVSATNISLMGGSGGADASATITSEGSQSVTAGQAIGLAGGTGSGAKANITQEGNAAGNGIDQSQTVTAMSLALQGGDSDGADALIEHLGIVNGDDANQAQTIDIAGAVTIEGGSVAPSAATIVHYGVVTGDRAVQTQTVQAGSLALDGGAALSDVPVNGATIRQAATSTGAGTDFSQSITVDGAMSIQGGSGTRMHARVVQEGEADGVGGTGRQTVAADSLTISGQGDNANGGLGSYPIAGVAGAQGTVDVSQSVTVTNELRVEGGPGNDSFAYLDFYGVGSGENVDASQSLSADAIVIQGGTGAGTDVWVGTYAMSRYAPTSTVSQTFTANSLTIAGGSGANSYVTVSNGPEVQGQDQAVTSADARQVFDIAGEMRLSGGSGAGSEVYIEQSAYASSGVAVSGVDASQSIMATDLIVEGATLPTGTNSYASIDASGWGGSEYDVQSVVVANSIQLLGGGADSALAYVESSGSASWSAASVTIQGGTANITAATATSDGLFSLTTTGTLSILGGTNPLGTGNFGVLGSTGGATTLNIGGNIGIVDGVGAGDDAVVGAGTTLTIDAGASIDLQANPIGSAPELVGTDIILAGGTVTGNGTMAGIVSNTGAILAPGASPGTLGVDGSLVESSSAALAIEIGGTGPSEHDIIEVTGPAALGGGLNVSLIDGFVPQAGDSFTILTASSGINGGFAFTTLPDLAPYHLGWQVTNTGNALVLEVALVNQAPTDIILDNSSVPENAPGAVIGNLSVIDPDATDTHMITVDDTRFEIVGGQLKLKDGISLDHEIEPTVSVELTAADPSQASYSETFLITVTDVNEPPTVSLANTNTTLPENTDTSAQIKIADIVVTDDALGTNDLSLTGADAGLFQINGTGLYLKAGTALDHETKPVLDVTVAVDDAALGGNPDDTAALSITVTDVNEPPTTTGLSNITVDEDASDTVIDLTGSFTDPEDGAGGLTYSVQSDTNPALFSQVDIQAGTLTLDYAANAYGTADIVVRGTDSGGLWVESTFSVVVNPEPDTLTWTNAAADGDWNNPGNWDLGIVPENGDTVIIPSGADITFSGDVALADLSLSDQTLTLAPGATLTVADLSLDHATINGSGEVDVTTAFDFDGSRVAGNVALITEAGSGTTLSATAVSGLADAASWSSFGTVSWDGTGDFSIGNAAVFTNESGATFEIGTGASLLGTGQFLNLGSALKTDGSTTTISPSFDHQGTLNIDGGTLTFTGGFTQSGGASTTLYNGGTLASGNGAVDLEGGTLGGTGSVGGDLTQNGGSISPGFSPGEVQITGNWTLGPGSTTLIELAGPGTAGVNYDLVAVTGTANLGGTLQVTLLGGYVPAAGDSFTIVTYGSEAGQFQTLNLPDISAQGLQWSVSYTATGVELTAEAPASTPQTPQTPAGSNPPPSQLTGTTSNTGSPTGSTGNGPSAVAEAAVFEPDLEETDYISAVVNDQTLDQIYGTEAIAGASAGTESPGSVNLSGGESIVADTSPPDQGSEPTVDHQGAEAQTQQSSAVEGSGLTDALSGEAGQLSAEAAEILQTLKEAAEYLRCGH